MISIRARGRNLGSGAGKELRSRHWGGPYVEQWAALTCNQRPWTAQAAKTLLRVCRRTCPPPPFQGWEKHPQGWNKHPGRKKHPWVGKNTRRVGKNTLPGVGQNTLRCFFQPLVGKTPSKLEKKPWLEKTQFGWIPHPPKKSWKKHPSGWKKHQAHKKTTHLV